MEAPPWAVTGYHTVLRRFILLCYAHTKQLTFCTVFSVDLEWPCTPILTENRLYTYILIAK